MKKLLVMLAAGTFFATSMMSCSSKCGHCETNGSSGSKICSSDNHAVYDAAVTSCATGSGTWKTE